MLHYESKCSSLSYRRDMHFLSFAHTLAKNPHLVDNRNLPTRRNQGIRWKAVRSLKPIVIRSAIYRAISRWNSLKKEYTMIEDLSAFKLDYKDCLLHVYHVWHIDMDIIPQSHSSHFIILNVINYFGTDCYCKQQKYTTLTGSHTVNFHELSMIYSKWKGPSVKNAKRSS